MTLGGILSATNRKDINWEYSLSALETSACAGSVRSSTAVKKGEGGAGKKGSTFSDRIVNI